MGLGDSAETYSSTMLVTDLHRHEYEIIQNGKSREGGKIKWGHVAGKQTTALLMER